jgi:dTDP-4-dehydrorhamnose 3,5-epimerase-like enzyme
MSKGVERFAFVALDPHADGRGWVINPFDGMPRGSGISNCHIFSTAPGACRGNHFHEDRDECVAVLSGSLWATDLDTGRQIELSPDSAGLLVIAPGVPHVFENRGGGIAVAICFSTARLDSSSPGTIMA